jgi:hypothetical protein
MFQRCFETPPSNLEMLRNAKLAGHSEGKTFLVGNTTGSSHVPIVVCGGGAFGTAAAYTAGKSSDALGFGSRDKPRES